MDIDAIGKHMPGILDFKARVERLLDSPFAAKDAEAQTALKAEFEQLRGLADKIPTIEDALARLDALAKDVEALKSGTAVIPADQGGKPLTTVDLDTYKATVESDLATQLAAKDQEIASLTGQVTDLKATMEGLAANLEAISAALDVNQPDLGTAPAPDASAASGTDGGTSQGNASQAAPLVAQDPS